ncbi:unnamed protein product [Rhizopus microsporus]
MKTKDGILVYDTEDSFKDPFLPPALQNTDECTHRKVSIETLRDPVKRKKVANFIRTDGFTVDVVLVKSTETNDNEHVDYSEQDFDISLLGDVITSKELSDISLCVLNSNRGQVIAASYGEGESYHQVRRCSTREYYTYTGSKRHEKRERMSNEDMIDVLLNTLTTKTAGISRYLLL